MPTLNPGQTRTFAGKYNQDECTTEADLIRNQNLAPNIKPMMWRVDKRQLTTLITSGATLSPYGMNLNAPEKFNVKKGTPIGNSSMQFNVMGRITDSSVIVQQIGSSGADGSFTLLLADRNVYKGHMVVFGNANRYTAYCLAEPTSTAGGWVYNFIHPQGEVFNYAIHAQPSTNGTATLFPATTAYAEGSEKGFSRSMNPDRFIVDMTIQRKTISLTGDAANDVTWYEYMGTEGLTKGWKYELVRQGEATFAWENEYNKIFGVSSMKNPDGTRRQVSPILDPDTNLPVTVGDGIEEQIMGGNEIYGSGTNGNVTEDDMIEAMSMLTKTSNSTTNGVNLVFMTGMDGFYNFQRIAARIAIAQGGQIWQAQKGGDMNVVAGYTFNKIMFGGSTLTVIVHPMFDDKKLFPALGTDGKSIMSSTYIGGNIGDDNDPNIEIVAKGAHGGNRDNVTATLNGMTGLPGDIITQKDAWTYAMLKQDLIAIYNTRQWMVLRKGQ